MRRATAALFLLGSLAGPSSAQAPPDDTARLSWLEGRWQGTSDGVAMEEHWTAPRGGALLGVHRDVKGGRMVSYEFLRIQATPEGIVYFASPSGAAVTPFKLAELGEKRMVSYEFLRIQATPEGIVYFASPSGAAVTPFKLAELGENRVVFENRQHDFPQRILYWTDSAGALHARIEGPQDGKTVSEEWVWTRAR